MNGISNEIYTLTNDPQIRPSTNIVISKNTAKDYLENTESPLENLITKNYQIFPSSSQYTGYIYDATLGDFIAPCSKLEFDRFVVFLKNSQNILRNTYEFGKPVVKKVAELILKKKNVINYINRHLIDLDDKSDDRTSLFMATLASRFMFNDEIVVNCKNECQAKALYIQIQNMLQNSNIEDKNENNNNK